MLHVCVTTDHVIMLPCCWPQVVYDTALQLYCLHLINTSDMQLTPIQRRSQALPYAWLYAVLLVVIKLLYGLGSAAAAGRLPLLQKAPGPPNGWLAWAQHALQQLPGISSLPLSEQEVRCCGSMNSVACISEDGCGRNSSSCAWVLGGFVDVPHTRHESCALALWCGSS
jgi:hypothetical protein